MGAETTTFTLNFKTIAELTGLDRLMTGVQSGAQKVEVLNARLTSAAATANGVLTATAAKINAFTSGGGGGEREARLQEMALAIKRQHGVTDEYALKIAGRRLAAEEAILAARMQAGAVLGSENVAAEQRAATDATSGGFFSALLIGVTAGYQLYQYLTAAADESMRLERETRKQTDELVRQLTLWRELARAAGNFGDVAKLGENIEKDLGVAAKKLEEFREKELSKLGVLKVLADQLAQIFGSAIPGHGPKPFEEEFQRRVSTQEAGLQSLLRDGLIWRETADQAAAAWQSLKLEPLNDAISKQSSLVAEAQAKYAALKAELRGLAAGTLDEEKTARAANALKELNEAGRDIKLTTDRLNELTGTQTKLATESEKVAIAISKIGVGEAQALATELEDIRSKLLQLGVDAASPNEALEKAKNLTEEIAEKVVGLAGNWVQVESKIADANRQLQTMLDHEAVIRATAYGTRDEAYKAEWGAKYNKILQEREKLGRDTSAGSINDQIAAELAAAERKKEWARDDRADLTAGKTAATDALTQAKFLLTNAEQVYRGELLQTKLLEEAGLITHEQATQRNLQATRDYIAELQRLRATLPALIKQLEAVGNTKGAATAKLEYQQLTNKILEAQAILANSGFFGRMSAQIRQLKNEWSDLGKQIGGFLTQQFGAFASTAGQMISDLIFRTGNWKQSLLQLGQAFVTQLATMVIQWVLSQTILAALNAAFGAANNKLVAGYGKAAAAAWAPAATSASIATSGVAAGTGLVAYIAALGSGVAAAVGLAGGFQQGGFTGHGPADEIAGFVHRGEVVFPAGRVNEFGRDFLVRQAIGSMTRPASFHGSGPSGGSSFGGSGGGRGRGSSGIGDMKAIVVNDTAALRKEILNSPDSTLLIINAINKKSYLIRRNA